jgi:hypothetical protein
MMSDEPTPDEANEPSDRRRRMRQAVRAVRREGKKAAVIVATVDAAVALLAVTFFFRVVAVDAVPAAVPLPGPLLPLAGSAPGDAATTPTVHGAVYAGVGAALVVFALDVGRQLRHPPVVRFEGVNPSVAEALRTARDAVEDGAETTMAHRLYDDVLTRLRETSSVGLLDLRRLGVGVVLLVALAVGNVAVVTEDIQIQVDGDGTGGGDGTTRPSEYGGLQDPDSVLGEPTDVGTDGDDINASIPTSGDGGTGNVSSAPSSYDASGFSGDASVESQQAGFAEQERIDDAELIRDYNLRIRQTDDDQ